jgi:hypothetical protein
MGATADEARKARERARKQNSNRGSTGSTDRLVMDLTRGKSSLLDKVAGRYVNKPEQRAANIMQQRRANDTARTATRATAIEKREAKKKAADTLKKGVSGANRKATKRAERLARANGASKPKAKPKPKATLSKSEKDFIAGQKFKAKIVKKTGVYPNTAR